MKEWVEIVGLPTSILNNKLEEILFNIFDKVGVKISHRNTIYCHRVGSQGHTIVKFSHKKDNKPINTEY